MSTKIKLLRLLKEIWISFIHSVTCGNKMSRLKQFPRLPDCVVESVGNRLHSIDKHPLEKDKNRVFTDELHFKEGKFYIECQYCGIQWIED